MEELRKQVDTMRFRIRDMLDVPNDAAAGRLLNEVSALHEDIQMKKQPRALEERVVRIISILRGDAKRTPIMNFEHIQMLEKWFEGLRGQLRKLQ